MPASRLVALDGLRGIAAVIVLVHHSLLLVPGLAAPYFGHEVHDSPVGLLVYTPLHVFWSGTEAVYLFFILSGLVLGLGVRSRAFSWLSYFPSRIVRLYLPVIGAVALGALVMAFTPNADHTDSQWVRERPLDYEITGMLTDATLVGGTSSSITPLWSLQWEVLFSLLLPLYVYLARRLSARVQLPVFIALAMLGAWAGVGALKFLPMFGIGVALASSWDTISAGIARIPRMTSAVIFPVAIVAAVLMATSYWTVQWWMPADVAVYVTLPVVLVGISIIIVLSAQMPMLSRLLSSRPMRFLGLISFSLYLVHEPIVIAVSKAIDRPTLAAVVAMPIAIAVSILFYRIVERPSHRLSRRVRDRADADDNSPGVDGWDVAIVNDRVRI
jgi:peptidoglycan/LPS O-acetylase OafA/YrhL